MYLLGIHLYQFSNRLWGPAEINICIEAKSQLKAEKKTLKLFCIIKTKHQQL